MRKTKIIATIGPASDSPEVLEELVAAGLDVARLNSSHSAIDELENRLIAVREASKSVGRHVAIMLDLAGPKLRLGEVAEGTELETGSHLVIVAGDDGCVGDRKRVCIGHDGLADALSEGDRLLIDDGAVELVVEGVDHGAVRAKVKVGGALSSRKGLNAPGVDLGLEPVTDQDREVLAWGLDAGVDLVAHSFIRSADDIAAVRATMSGKDTPIVAKIEKSEAVDNLPGIVAASDGVMVARGDLGVETSPEEVPVVQRRVIAECRARGVPVIVATQMLESMTSSPRPTRAEASDVANAIFDQADAVMLSAETAIGRFPVTSVETMVRIAARAESSTASDGPSRRESAGDARDVTAAVSAAACELANDLDLAALVTATQSGATARSIARHRPRVPIVAATPSEAVARRLQSVWGVIPLVVPLADDTDLMLDSVLSSVRDAGLAPGGARVAVTAGIASRVPGATDFVLVREVPR